MKKIIALAVAGAFVAPVAFADISVGGSVDMFYYDKEEQTAANNSKQIKEDSTLAVKASTELANGLSVSADISLNGSNGAIGNTDGTSITIAGPFGAVSAGDNAGAVDGVDEVISFRSVSYVTNDDAVMGGGDAGARWDLPTIVPNLALAITYSAKNDNPGNSQDDASGVSLKYTAGAVTVAYAQEDVATTEIAGGSAVAGFGGLTVGIESWESTAGAAKTDLRAWGLGYEMGDVEVLYRSSETASEGVDLSDIRTIAVNYSLGSGVTAYVEMADEKMAANVEGIKSETAFGVEYKF